MDGHNVFRAYGHLLQRQDDLPVSVVSYDAGHIVLSFFTSLVGCITTLELLQRRTSTRGSYNWFLLLASAVTMGGIGIWGMHFVGNRAIVLAGGIADEQILYNSGFTAVSFFMPIFVLLIAFYVLGIQGRARYLYIALAGFLSGSAICGMHYLGQLGIENYHCSYHVSNVVGSAVIAVFASMVALFVFFRLRETWTDSWWKRALCGAVLALAVSGMHWTASVGTEYRWKGIRDLGGSSRNRTSIIAACLSMGACIALLAIAAISGRSKRSTRIKAQRLVLACAYFNESGQLMVTHEGALPSEKITNHYVERTFGEDDLSRMHPTFIWVFKASRNWAILKDLIPLMREHIESDPATRRYRPGISASGAPDDSSEASMNFHTIFKQLFCIAAQELAGLIHEPLESLGTVFEEPLDTGSIANPTNNKSALRRRMNKMGDLEKAAKDQSLSRGKYLFVNRQLTKTESANFAAMGYRFASLGQIAEPLAKNMQVNRETLLSRLDRMKLSVSTEHLPPPGVHLACFMLRPSIRKSFDVLVPWALQNQLPYATIRAERLTAKQIKQLQRFDGMVVTEILKILINQSVEEEVGEEIRWQLYNAFVKLIDVMGNSDAMMKAKFSAREFEVPCRHDPDSETPKTCTMFTVRVMLSIHTAPPRPELTYTPMSFLNIQQQVDATEPNSPEFAASVKTEFVHLSYLGNKYQGVGSKVVQHRRSEDTSSSRAVETPRSAMFKIPVGRLHLSRDRRSDETMMVEREREKSIGDGSEVEMTATASAETANPFEPAGNASSPRAGTFPSADKGSWVTELFSLFELKGEGWGASRPGWKWEVNVENSFEVGTKARGAND